MKYAEYAPFIYDWLPEVPSHWVKKSLRQCFTLSDERKGFNSHLKLLSVYREYGVIPKDSRDDNRNVESEDTSKYKVVHKTDLVINKMKLWQGSLGISQYDGFVSPAYIVCHTDSTDNLNYLNSLLRSSMFKTYYNRISYGIRVGQWDSDFYDFRNMYIAVPPRDEQDQIVRYLDWQISKINKLIHGYQRQIKLLNELRLTTINNAVTKGLDSSANFKSTNSNWIGNIPNHWDCGTIKQHFCIKKRIAGKEGYDVLSITQQGLKVKNISSNEGQMAANYSNYQFVYPGDFAMNHMDLLTGFVGLSSVFGVTSPDYRVFSLEDTDNCEPEYYLYIFQLGYKRKIFYGLGKGAASKGRWRMPAINFNNFVIPVPPIAEQKEIVQFLKTQEQIISHQIENIEHQISLLKEYRTRLVSDVVTGQKDVRGIEIPDYVPESEDSSDDITENAEEQEVDSADESDE